MEATDVEPLRLAVYRTFSETGRAPTTADLADRTGLDSGVVGHGLSELARDRHLVLGRNGEILMAHPFSAIPLGFAVMGRRTLWWGGCAWDSFALPHLLPDEDPVLVDPLPGVRPAARLERRAAALARGRPGRALSNPSRSHVG